jgi:uncharacterized protein (TIGR02300 family)
MSSGGDPGRCGIGFPCGSGQITLAQGKENPHFPAAAPDAKAFDSQRVLCQSGAFLHQPATRGTTMPNPEWGTKRICPTTGKRFYDLNKTPIISPYTGEVVDIETARRRAASVVTARPLPEKDEDVLVDDLEAEDILEPGVADDADLDDELLEDDADDNVSLDDLADVGGDEEEP